MIEPAMKLFGAFGKVAERRAHSLLRVMRVNPFPRRRDAERSQAKARCGDARNVAVIFVEQ